MSGPEADDPGARRAVNVVISGKEYRIVSAADAQWLQGVATGVDEAMALVRDRTQMVDSLDVAVLTALNLARELVLLREQGAGSGGRAESGDVARVVVDSVLDPARLEALIHLAESAIGREPLA